MARRLRRSAGAIGGRSGHLGTLPSVNYTPTAQMTTPTYDGSGNSVEPSAVYFPSGWNGHKWWLAMVPLPAGDSTKENPSILVSDDGLNWSVPAGLTNPIVAAPANGNNADPALFWNPNDNKLYCYYEVQDNTTASNCGAWVKSSTDGITWSAGTQIIVSAGNGDGALEPAVFWDGTQYVMLHINNLSGTLLKRRTSSSPTSGWSAATTITLPGGITPWHISVLREASGRVLLALCDTQTTRQGWICSSWDSGLTWQAPSRALFTTNSFAPVGPYRPTLIPWGTGNYRAYVSAINTYAIGTTVIPATEIP